MYVLSCIYKLVLMLLISLLTNQMTGSVKNMFQLMRMLESIENRIVLLSQAAFPLRRAKTLNKITFQFWTSMQAYKYNLTRWAQGATELNQYASQDIKRNILALLL